MDKETLTKATHLAKFLAEDLRILYASTNGLEEMIVKDLLHPAVQLQQRLERLANAVDE